MIFFDKEKCCACGACAVACMALHDTDLAAGERPLRRVRTEEEWRGGVLKLSYYSESCRHCENARCMAACPGGALRRDAATGYVFVQRELCTGCGACLGACPFGAVSRDRDGKAAKCDGCMARAARGEKPVCVLACPYGALRG